MTDKADAATLEEDVAGILRRMVACRNGSICWLCEQDASRVISEFHRLRVLLAQAEVGKK